MKNSTFDIKVWYEYRKRAQKIGAYINSFKDEWGAIRMTRQELAFHMHEISTILKQCSNYMDKNGMPMPKPLWYFDIKNPKTHLSSCDFQYVHLLEGV